jgi:hypothetical protein
VIDEVCTCTYSSRCRCCLKAQFGAQNVRGLGRQTIGLDPRTMMTADGETAQQLAAAGQLYMPAPRRRPTRFVPRWVEEPDTWARAIDEIEEALGTRDPADPPSRGMRSATETIIER